MNNTETRPIAYVDIGRCLSWNGIYCQLCYSACPLRDQGLVMEDLQPVVDVALCDGCGKCVEACRSINDRPPIEILTATFESHRF